MTGEGHTAPAQKPRFVTRGFVLLFIINFFAVGSFFMLYTTMARYAILTFACSDAVAGLTSSIFLIASVIARPLCGRYGDRFGLRKTTIVACAITLVGCLLYFASASNIVLLMFSRFLHGASFGVANTTVPSLVAKSMPREVVGTGTGWFMLSNTIGCALSPLLGLLLSNSGNYEALFMAACLFSVIALVLACMLKPDESSQQPADAPAGSERTAAPVTGWRSLIDPDVFRIALFMFVQGLVYGCFNTFVNSYSFEIGLENVAPYLFAINSAVLLFTRPLAGKIMDMKGENTAIYPSLAFAAVGYLLCAYASNGFMLVMAAIFMALGWGNCMSLGMGIIARDIPPERTTVAVSTFFLMCDTGMGLGPFVLGFALTVLGYSRLFVLCAIVMVLALASYWFFHGRKQHRSR